MWTFELTAPNGLSATVTLDDMLVDRAVDPKACIMETLQKPVQTLLDRKDEKPPTA